MEAFYTFTWAPRQRGGENRGPRRDRSAGAAPAGERAPKEAKPRGEGRPPRSDGGKGDGNKGGRPQGKGGKPQGKGGAPRPQKFEARPPKPEKKIDPDSPFAALAALKGKV